MGVTNVATVDDPWVGAACREPSVNAEWFFPTPGQSPKAAKAVCRRCPLRRACLIYAMRVEARLPKSHRHGIFAGLTPARREELAERGWGSR